MHDSPTLRRPNRAVFFRNIAVWRDAEDDAISSSSVCLLSRKNSCGGTFFFVQKLFFLFFPLNPKNPKLQLFVFFISLSFFPLSFISSSIRKRERERERERKKAHERRNDDDDDDDDARSKCCSFDDKSESSKSSSSLFSSDEESTEEGFKVGGFG